MYLHKCKLVILLTLLVGLSIKLIRFAFNERVSSGSPTFHEQTNVDRCSANGALLGLLHAVDRSCLLSAMDRSLKHMHMDHPDLVAVTQAAIIDSPAPRGQHNLDNASRKYYSQYHQDQAVDKILRHMTHGFFVEAGAFEGEFLSNSLFFEKERSWTGLLVEPLPEEYATLRAKRRHAYTANVCLGTGSKPYKTAFSNKDVYSAVGTDINQNRGEFKGMFDVLCMPLYTLLKAVGRTRVDYFSLDIESLEVELQVLKNLPWDKVEFGLIDVEFNDDINNLQVLRELMDEKGFVEVVFDEIDSFFLNKSLATPGMPLRQRIKAVIAEG